MKRFLLLIILLCAAFVAQSQTAGVAYRFRGGNAAQRPTACNAGSPTDIWYSRDTDELDVCDAPSHWKILATASTAGPGNVVGPASAVNNHLAVFSGITGKLIADGGAIPSGITNSALNGQVAISDGTNIIGDTDLTFLTDTLTVTKGVITNSFTLNAAPLTIMGNLSGAGIFGTSGIRIKGTPGTLTDTTSSGTVATSYTDVLGGNTIAATSATTVTNWFSMYVNQPVAGSNVTLTNKWAIGADSLKVGTSNQLTVTAAGALGINAVQTNTVSSATAFEIGPNGSTNPVLRLITNVASQADGISISGGAAGAGTTIQALTSGTNTGIALKGAGTGGVTINVGQTTSAATDLLINPTTKASGNLIDAQVNSVSQFKVTSAGSLTVPQSITATAGSVTAGNHVFAGSGSVIQWNGSTRMTNSSTDGILTITNAAANDFSRLQFGGTTSSFPAIKRSSAGLSARLADDSADTSITLSAAIATDFTNTTGGTTGAQTINKRNGSVNFAAAATSLVVTNSTVTTASIIQCTIGTNDTTMKSLQCVAASGSFTIFSNAAATAETRVYFTVLN